MTFVITGGCCNDSSCIAVCPVQCIRPRPGDPDFTTADQLYIDPATCIDCGACMDECPVDAIYGEWDLPDELDEMLAVNAEYFETNPIEASPPPELPKRVLPQDTVLRVAVVGSGPAGCYAAAELSDMKNVSVSLFDKLPTPFGLVRAGVAPDHAKTKQITKRFGSVLNRPNVECYFNVDVGSDVTVDELRQHHDAVIWAGGASTDRRLGVPGEDLDGCVAAREFVAWYNGHPDFADRTFNLRGQTVVVIGNGNVALDVARILTQPVDGLNKTDIAAHALEALKTGAVERVVVTARRGPEHAAYTVGELASLITTEGLQVTTNPQDVSSLADGGGRALDLVRSLPAPGDGSTVLLRYGLTPVAIVGDGRVEGVEFKNADGETEFIETALVIKSIGYRGQEVPGLPFDDTTGTLPNEAGRVLDPASGEALTGIYCSGWIKRGPSGMIGTNKHDSAETVDSLLQDLEAGRLVPSNGGSAELRALLSSRNDHVVTDKGWLAIDKAERSAGRRAGRTRLKLVTREEMLAAASGT